MSEAPEISTAKPSSGDITIQPKVVASVVRLCTLDVPGVYSVGKGFVDRLTEIFFKHESDRGVRVVEDEHGAYLVDIRVILQFGAALQDTARLIQETVVRKVQQMTGKPVAAVHVLVDGVRTAHFKKTAKHEELPHTD